MLRQTKQPSFFALLRRKSVELQIRPGEPSDEMKGNPLEICMILSFLILGLICLGKETPEKVPKEIPLRKKEFRIPSPDFGEIEKDPSATILLIGLEYRKKNDKGEDQVVRTEFYTFDPARPELGFRKMSTTQPFRLFRLITPVFGEWILVTHKRHGKEEFYWPELSTTECDLESWGLEAIYSGGPMCWFNLLTGERSPSISDSGITLVKFGEREFFDPSYCSIGYGQLYDINRGILVRYEPKISYGLRESGRGRVLGIFKEKGKAEIIEIDLRAGKGYLWGELPNREIELSLHEVLPAGENCKDGIFIDTWMGVWLKKRGWDKGWRKVIGPIAVEGPGACGGRPQVTYLGSYRFAVTATMNFNRKFGDMLSFTMLIDGLTGKILDETDPIPARYPKENIPWDWWDPEIRQPMFPRQPWRRFFSWDKDNSVFFFGDSGILRLQENWNILFSESGEFAVVWGRVPAGRKQEKTLLFKVIIGPTGKTYTLSIPEGEFEIFVNALRWLKRYKSKK